MGQGGYGQIGNGAQDYGTYDPYGLGPWAASGLQSLQWNAPQLGQRGYTPGTYNGPSSWADLGIKTQGYDPNAYFQQFQGQQGYLQNMAQGATGPLQQQLNALAAMQAKQAKEQVETQFGGFAGKSGAMGAALGQGMALPFAQAQADIAGKRLDLTGQLWGNAMSQNAAQQAQKGQMGLGWGQLQAQSGLQASQLADQAKQWRSQLGESAFQFDQGYGLDAWSKEMQGKLGQYGLGFGQQTTVAPTYEYQPSIWEKLLGAVPGILSSGGVAAGGAADLTDAISKAAAASV